MIKKLPNDSKDAHPRPKIIDQQSINDAAWAAHKTFDEVMEVGDYKNYILVMLFLKYISDVWNDHYEEFKKQYGDDEDRIRRNLDRERFILPDKAKFSYLYERRNESNIGELINEALVGIEEKNKGKLENVFRNIDFNSKNLGETKEKNNRLKKLLEDFNKSELNLGPAFVSEEAVGNAYIHLIEHFASKVGKKADKFYTPQRVSELVARLCKPKPGARICDPTCGSGGLLIEAAKTVGSTDYSLFGMEVNRSTWALCKLNMLLRGNDGKGIKWCNTLTAPQLIKEDNLMKFDYIVANPPFSLEKWGADEAEVDPYNRFWRGMPPKTKGDYAFISHMIEVAVAKEGRIAVIVPHGVLFRSSNDKEGKQEQPIRKQLITDNLLDAVICLPEKLFPKTPISVAILIFDRSREKGGVNEKCKDVLFINASDDYQAGKNQNVLLSEHVNRIVAAYEKRAEVPKYAHCASAEEIRENEFNLNIPRYVDTFEEEEEVDIEAVQREIDVLEAELVSMWKNMKRILAGKPGKGR